MNFSEKKLHFNTLVDLVCDRARSQPDRTGYIFLVDGENERISLTYKELERAAMAIAAQLQTISQPGARALLIYPPGLDYIKAFFGCLFAGIVAVPIYPPKPNRSLIRIQGIIANAGSRVVLTNQVLATGLERAYSLSPDLASQKLLVTDNLPLSLARQWQKPNIDGDSLAFLQYTSGSTAAPKGVAIAHSNLLHNLNSIYHCFEHTPASVGVIWLPPYHDMGSIGGILQPLYGSFPVILMSPLMFLQNPLRWLQAITRFQGTTSGGPNFAYELCLRKIKPESLEQLDLSSWQVAFNGAEPIDGETIAAFSKYFAPTGFRPEAFYPCYGMAEATLIITGGIKNRVPPTRTFAAAELSLARAATIAIDNGKKIRQLVSCGRSIPDQEIVIVHPEKLTQLADGEVGEIWVRGPSVARGYWQQSEATQRNFAAYLADSGAGAFLRTGDLGFIFDGELFCTGRLKDTIILNGRNYYPQDIEKTVEKNHPQLRPHCSAVFAYQIAKETKLAIAAEVERSYQQSQKRRANNGNKGSLATGELIKSIRKAVWLEHELQMEVILLLKPGSIPKTSSGKIQRYATRAGFLSESLEIVDRS